MTTTSRTRPAGSISGFTQKPPQVSDTDDASNVKPLSSKTYSTEEIVEALRRLQDVLDPQALIRIQESMQDHINDTSNPHDVSITDIRGSFREDLFNKLLPGIPPSSYPWTVLIPETLATISNNTTRDTPIYICNRYGYLEKIPEDTPAIDYCTGHPMLASWSARTNTIPQSQPQNNSQSRIINGSPSSPTGGDPVSPTNDRNYLIVNDNTSMARHGYSFTVTPSSTKDHTASFFIRLIKSSGYLTVFIEADQSQQITIDLATQVYTNVGTSHLHVHTLASGWLRIGLQHIPTSTNATSLTVLYHTDMEMLQYEGNGTPIFGIHGLQYTEGIGLSPHIPTSGQPDSHGETSYLLTPEDLPNDREGMFVLNTHMSPVLEPSTFPGSTIELGPEIMLGRTATDNVIHFHADTPDAFSFNTLHNNIENMYIGVAYDATCVKYATSSQKIIVESRDQERFGDVTPWIIDPVEGGIYNITTYPNSDSATTLKFLLQEDLDVSDPTNT